MRGSIHCHRFWLLARTSICQRLPEKSHPRTTDPRPALRLSSIDRVGSCPLAGTDQADTISECGKPKLLTELDKWSIIYVIDTAAERVRYIIRVEGPRICSILFGVDLNDPQTGWQSENCSKPLALWVHPLNTGCLKNILVFYGTRWRMKGNTPFAHVFAFAYSI